MEKMSTLEKQALCDAKFQAHDCARGARKLLDSKFVESTLTAKEMKALESCTEFLTLLESKYQKLYDKHEAWKD